MAKHTFKQAFLIAGAFFGIPIVGAIMLTPSAEEIAAQDAARAADPTSGATYACREFIEATLIAPASADFGHWSGWPAVETDRGSVKVRAMLDAQNEYGAMIRGRFTCEVTKRDGQWFLTSLEED